MTTLTVGITGSYGAGRTTVAGVLEKNHSFRRISLSQYLKDELKTSGRSVTVGALQDVGDQWRETHGPDYLAKLAAEEMAADPDASWVVDGIKHPSEWMLLRERKDGYLLAVQASRNARWQRVAPSLKGSRDDFDRVEARDSRETDQWGNPIEHGQRVADCLPLADAVIWNDRIPNMSSRGKEIVSPEERRKINEQGSLEALTRKVGRFADLVRNPGGTRPYEVEIRMCQAYTVARRSPCIQRQVGALITNEADRILAEACNDFPVEQPDCRGQFGRCYREQIREEDLLEFSKLFRCGNCSGGLSAGLVCEDCGQKFRELVPRRKNLDYCRCLHAEENALLQMSKHGGMGVKGGTIYTTTFPCNLCANKIVNCGIAQVVFAEAYPMEEAFDILAKSDVQLVSFEGVTHNAFHRLFGGGTP